MAPFSVKDFLANIRGTQNTAETVRWTCETIILSTGDFEGTIEDKLNSW